MSWTPIFWLLAFIPALIALYFLRLKRQRVVVSSNLLWMRAVEDLHVNAPFQRLRRNLLLILQLIILIALILALWRPQTAQLGEGGANLVVLIDVSASMEAKGDGGETPLAVAKRRAVDLIRTMGKADRMVLMTFAQRAEAVLALTGNKERLERAVNALSAVALPSDLRQALVVAASLAQSMGESKIYVLGDGCYEDLATLPNEVKGQRIEFLWDTKPRTNVGIIEIDTRHNFETDRRTEVTVLVENFGDEEWSGTLSLEIDGNVRDAEAVTIEPGGSKLSVFDLTSAEGSVVQASIDSDDALPADNRAWVRLHRAERISATLVGDGNPLIEMALTAARRRRPPPCRRYLWLVGRGCPKRSRRRTTLKPPLLLTGIGPIP